MSTFKSGGFIALGILLIASAVDAQPPRMPPEQAKRYLTIVAETREQRRPEFEELLRKDDRLVDLRVRLDVDGP